MNKVKKPLMLLLATLALGASGCESSNITVKEKVELIDPIEPRSGPLDPITDEIRALAATKVPEKDPSTVISTKRSEYDFHSQSYIDIDLQSGDLSTREGHSLIYLFRGSYKEGYQGDYYCYYANIYLWDDGFVTGISNTEPFKGYWYNDESGDGRVTDADRLGIICDSDTYQKYSNIIFEKGEFFYDWRGQIYLNTGTADRSIDIGVIYTMKQSQSQLNLIKQELDLMLGTHLILECGLYLRFTKIYDIHMHLKEKILNQCKLNG